ncbi:MAG: tetratricopeptide repeat protein [bacterium]|nr:tetratricopeptide repeat protein [bacterium]
MDLTPRFGLLQLTGTDRESFLQNLTSNDVVKLPAGSGQRNAVLDKKSCIIHDFHVYKTGESLLLVTTGEQVSPLCQYLDRFLFAEQVEIRDLSRAIRLFAVQGPESWPLTGQWIPWIGTNEEIGASGILPNQSDGPVRWVMSHSFTGDPGCLLAVEAGSADIPVNHFKQLDIPQAQWDQLETQRIESGYLEPGKDFDQDTRVQMLNLEEKIVSLTKGCFPGQEVVARIASRSEIQWKLMGLEFRDSPKSPFNLKPGQVLEIDGKTAGIIKRAAFSAIFSRTLAIALVGKNYAVDKKMFDFLVEGAPLQARVIKLPFYVSPHILGPAQNAYDTGMSLYHEGQFEASIEHFNRSLSIYPDFVDAVEAKAMSVEKVGNLEDAILLNKQFAQMDPNAIMARTNLSRLYMLKGWKDKAEEEQGKAMSIQWRQLAAKNSQQDEDALRKQQEEAERAERERKLKIFKQVIELDPEDEVANFGYGKIQLDSGQYGEAESALKIVIRNNPEFSAAYEALVKSLKAQGKLDEAKELAKAGIDVAEKRGDLMPANAMHKMLSEMKG